MASQRLWFLDRLRFWAVIILILFHTALIFSAESNFPIKNLELSGWLDEIIFFFHGWRLALLFFISGVGTNFMVKIYSERRYVKERIRRLVPPLLFGILVVVPPQIYYERRYQGFLFDSFGSFYLESFSSGLYPYGNISWNHLWFVAYLLLYALISIPVFQWIRHHQFIRGGPLGITPTFLWWTIFLASVTAILKPYSTGIQNIVNDLAMFLFYWLIFLSGFICHEWKCWTILETKRKTLLVAVLISTIIVYIFKWGIDAQEKSAWVIFLYDSIRVINAWCWVLSILAYGKKYLNTPGRYHSILNQSIFPTYILHQTVIVILAYWVVQPSWNAGFKYLLIVCSTVLICGLCFLVLRTNSITRVLFGISTLSPLRSNQE